MTVEPGDVRSPPLLPGHEERRPQEAGQEEDVQVQDQLEERW